MKNKFKSIGVLTFGLCVAFGLSHSNVSAAEDDSIIDVNVLSEEEGKSSVLEVEILDVPIVGDVNVNIPSEPETEASEALATVEVSDGVVDDLDVSVLEKTESKASLATVELESTLTDDVSVDVVSGEKTPGSFVGGVVEANAEDLPLLGGTHVGVLDKHVTADEDGKSVSAGLIQTDVDNGLLDDASVDVLAVENSEDGSEKREMSAVVDVSVDDDEAVLDDLGVSVLKRERSEAGMRTSLASVELETPVTDDLNVDVASGDRTASSFDGGLVEVNGENAPLLGEVHVGVLDRHVKADEEGKSISAGLIQTDLNDGLLEDTSAGVLVRKMRATEDGGLVESSGASLDLGLPGTDDVSADVLMRQRQFTIAIDEPPSVVVPPSTDDGAEESVTAPEEESDMPDAPESTDNATSEGNEEGQGTSTPPANEGDFGDGFSNEEDGTMENKTSADNVVEESEQDSAAGTGMSGDVDADSGSRTGELSGTVDASATFAKGKSGVMNGFAMNNADPHSSLPKTGGFWDGKRLEFLALALMVMGFAMRRLGKSTISAA